MDKVMPSVIKGTVSRPIHNCFFFLCDVFLLSIIMSLQGTCLNVYIMNRFSESIFPKILFVGDFFSVMISIAGMRLTYVYLCKEKEDSNDPDKHTFVYSPKKLFKKFPTSKLGLLPLSYISWLVYTSLLILKIVIIFISGLALELKNTDLLGPQTLKFTIGVTSIVFMLFVEAHNWDFVSSERRTYVTTVCVKTGFEIFDSVDMLSLITDQQLLQLNIPHNVLIPYEDLIFALVALNFILPFLSLYKLSLPDRPNQGTFSPMLPIHALYHILHLFFVDVPFLSVRVYAWVAFHAEISMFLMKNLLHIIISVRSLYPDLKQWVTRDKSLPPANNQPSSPNEFEDINLN